jgi:DNA-binding NtrC family response regulator
MSNPQRNILIVDDDADTRSNFTDILSEFGYQITTAEDGESALQLVREKNFDVVVLDYKMPGMDGATLYGEIKKLQPSVAAIMVTAWGGSDGVQRAMLAGTWDVLRKPVDIGELMSKLEHAAQAPLILVVDDDVDFCQTMWQILNDRRFRVAIAHDEAEGIRQAGHPNCQFAIIDIKLGSGDGRNVLKRIRQQVPGAKAVLISGDRRFTASNLRLSIERHADAFYQKPLDIEHLMETIDEGVSRN